MLSQIHSVKGNSQTTYSCTSSTAPVNYHECFANKTQRGSKDWRRRVTFEAHLCPSLPSDTNAAMTSHLAPPKPHKLFKSLPKQGLRLVSSGCRSISLHRILMSVTSPRGRVIYPCDKSFPVPPVLPPAIYIIPYIKELLKLIL